MHLYKTGGGGCTNAGHGPSSFGHRPSRPLQCRDGARRFFTDQERHGLHQARSAVKCSASRMKGELRPTEKRLCRKRGVSGAYSFVACLSLSTID